MIGTIRKHSSWLWFIIIAATIVSFVAYFNPASRQNNGGGGQSSGGEAGSINGQAISMDQFNEARREARLFYFLRFSRWPDNPAEIEKNGFDQDAWAYERLMLDAAMKNLKMQVSDQAAARTTRQILGIKDDQAFSVADFNKFVAETLVRNGVGLEDFDRFVRHQTGLEQLISLYGMSGRLITAKEAAFFYQRENEPMETQIATFQYSNYFPLITISPKDLEDFFTKNAASYRIPERVQLNYVRFDLTNFYADADKKISAITNYDQAVDRNYLEKGAVNFKDEKGIPLTADKAKAKIKKDNRDYLAHDIAAEQARKFVLALYGDHPDSYVYTTNDIFAAAAAAKLTVKTTAPFDERTGPLELGFSRQFNASLFNLTDKGNADQFYPTSPLPNEQGVVVVGFKQRFPSQAQTLAAVREKAYSDYRMQKAYEMIRLDSEKFEAAAMVGLKQGQSFDSIAAAQKLKVTTLPHYSMTTTNSPFKDRGDFETLQQSTFNLPVGQPSQFIPTEEGGMIAFVKARLPVDKAMADRDLPAYLEGMRRQRQTAAFQGWFQRQIADMHLVKNFGAKPKTSGS